MALQAQKKLVRKQFLISESNVIKLDKLAVKKNTSAAEVVRLAIEAYNPNEVADMPELMELVSAKLKDAIESTQHASSNITNTLELLDKQGVH